MLTSTALRRQAHLRGPSRTQGKPTILITNERHAGEEGVIRSDIAEMIDRSAAMAVYAYNAINEARDHNSGDSPTVPEGLAQRLAEQTYTDILRYSLDECSCACHTEHEHESN